ncbi:hypothetical protein LINPERPRIM_LOCUS37768, partial [Linum perenne]
IVHDLKYSISGASTKKSFVQRVHLLSGHHFGAKFVVYWMFLPAFKVFGFEVRMTRST